MKIGYFTLTDNPAGYGDRRRDPSQYFDEVIEEAIYAEALGYHSAWLPEHHFGLFGVLGATSTALAYIAGKTERIKLAPATILLPAHHPVHVAEQYATLDRVSKGRAIISAGRGYDKREYDAFGIPFEESRDRFFEGMHLMRKLLTQDNVTWGGKYYPLPDPVTVLPRSVQQPSPPISVAAFSRPTVEFAAENGFDVIFAPFAASMMFGSLENAVGEFKEIAAKAGHPNSKALCSYFFGLADNDAEERAVKERLLFYLKAITSAFPGDINTAPPHIAYFVDIVNKLLSMEPKDLGERSIVTGNPERVTEHLKSVEAAGISEVILYFNMGAYPHLDTMRMMERFAKEVMPNFE
jgi:alkanesulfonate monooxygenase SsuD/methylene tetrahydromethanopterin reductase-like flavin-dependent oxidoreductase (luciferase family)